jgi:hypothetical protein
MKKAVMEKFQITFLHTDGSVRTLLPYEVINEEIARLRFSVNWSSDMKILSCIEV